MSEHRHTFDLRIAQALVDLTALIAPAYPAAVFEVFWRDDPDGARLRVTVDIQDADDVIDLIRDKLLDIQIQQYLPVYVIPVQPLTRALAELGRDRESEPAEASPVAGV